MSEYELYKIREPPHPRLNFLFDKITKPFSKIKKIPIKNPKNILLIRNDHIGDMIYATPVFRELKRAFPKVRITVIADPKNSQIIEKDKNVDHIIKLGLLWRTLSINSFFNYFKIYKKIKSEDFDVGIDLRRSKFNIFFLLFLPKIKNRVAYFNANGGKSFLTHPVLYEKKILLNLEHINLIEKIFNMKIKNVWPYIATNKLDKSRVSGFIKKNKLSRYIVVLPGSTEKQKQWPIKKVNKFIELFHNKYPNYKVVVSSTRKDLPIINYLCKNRKNFCIPEYELNLREVSILLKKAKVVIANNGAGTDMGWVGGGNLVALAGGTVDLTVHMPQKKSIVIQPKLPYFPCKEAITWINVEEVMNAVEKFIKNKRENKE